MAYTPLTSPHHPGEPARGVATPPYLLRQPEGSLSPSVRDNGEVRARVSDSEAVLDVLPLWTGVERGDEQLKIDKHNPTTPSPRIARTLCRAYVMKARPNIQASQPARYGTREASRLCMFARCSLEKTPLSGIVGRPLRYHINQ